MSGLFFVATSASFSWRIFKLCQARQNVLSLCLLCGHHPLGLQNTSTGKCPGGILSESSESCPNLNQLTPYKAQEQQFYLESFQMSQHLTLLLRLNPDTLPKKQISATFIYSLILWSLSKTVWLLTWHESLCQRQATSHWLKRPQDTLTSSLGAVTHY